MLVLSRKEGQQIVVGEDVVLTITQIRGNRVKVGIQAPQDIAVRRLEDEETGNAPAMLLSNFCDISSEVPAR